MVEHTWCDAHRAKDGSQVEATEELTLAGESWDLCDEHAARFVAGFTETFTVEENAA